MILATQGANGGNATGVEACPRMFRKKDAGRSVRWPAKRRPLGQLLVGLRVLRLDLAHHLRLLLVQLLNMLDGLLRLG